MNIKFLEYELLDFQITRSISVLKIYVYFLKPGGEGQTPYDLTFNWNIINKKKKVSKI